MTGTREEITNNGLAQKPTLLFMVGLDISGFID